MISKIEEIIEEAKQGKCFILMDDENRENEGDVIIPAEFATPEAINFMITHARGLVCLAMQKKRIEELGLSLMTKTNGSRFETAFTTSIEAREGVSTGISAFDRSHTINMAINGKKEDIVTPGHIFPLIAKDGGVLVRAGHTEASVDISILAGLNPSSVICEIINSDGTMARMNDLIMFARTHGLKIGLIKDLIEYRSKKESIVAKVEAKPFAHSENATITTYIDAINGSTHYAITFGEIDVSKPVNVKFHAMNYITDIFSQWDISETVDLLKQKTGVLVLVNNNRPNTVQNGVIREYGIGVSIIKNLGISKVVIVSKNNITPVGIEGFGVEVVSDNGQHR